MTATSAAPFIRREVQNEICLLTFDRPESGANIFDADTLAALESQLDFIERESSLKGVIIASAKKSIFVAGADLQTLLRQAERGEMRAFIGKGQQIFNRLASLKIPTVAAIHGACAGGGYEVALACDYRVASDEPATRIGLPETTLGLVPAWGGCTRLPRLIGVEKALEVISKGKLYPAAEAKQLGLVDDVAAREQLLEVAQKKVSLGKRKVENRPAANSASQELRPPKESGNDAPRRALEIVRQTLSISPNESLRMELDAISELGETESTRNLIRNFFLADRYRKGTSKMRFEKVGHAAVIGAGVMGSGIAQWLSARGVSVILRDVTTEFVSRGLEKIEKTYAEAVKRGLMSEEKAKEGRARIVASANPGPLRDVEIVIEAASEKLEIKKGIFRELDTKMNPDAILATNTSALSISALAGETQRPARVIGLHFFNPVSRMKLVEVVIGQQTSDETKERALAFARQVGKIPVIVRDSPGFLVNRVLFPYLLDAAELFENGVDAKQIDEALVEWGMPMGPLRLMDEIGIDITVDIAATLEKSLGERARTPAILTRMRAEKMLGRKTGNGFYKYEGKQQLPNESLEQWRHPEQGEVRGRGRNEGEGSRGESFETAQLDPSTALRSAQDDKTKLRVAHDDENKLRSAHDDENKLRSAHDDENKLRSAQDDENKLRSAQDDNDDLALRLVYLMVNEAARCLEEKVVASPEDADYGMILGTGFAPFRGGPLRFADHFGISEMVRAGERHGGKFAPCNLLRQHAEKKTKFYEQ